MKKLTILLCGVLTLVLSACHDDYDTPDLTDYRITATDLKEPTMSIYDVKKKFCSSSDSAKTVINTSNFWTLVTADSLIFEGVIVGNDIGGNLYQSLYVRHIDKSKSGAEADQTILIGIKTTCLYPYFRLGQRIRINLQGLYVGVYSKTPKVGTPYWTSAGNNRLGPMPFEYCAKNIQLIGEPDLNAPELTPIDRTGSTGNAWLRATANRTWENSPSLGIVEGVIKEVQGAAKDSPAEGTEDNWAGVKESLPKILAPACLRDAGYAVDRTIDLGNGSKVTLRTSIQTEISFIPCPEGTARYTGMMSYYDYWEVQLRSKDDLVIK